LLALVINLVNLVLMSVRLRILLGVFPSVRPVSFFWILRVIWMGLGAAQVALGALSGDALRVVALRSAGHRLANAILMILTDRLIGLLGLTITGIGGVAVVTGTGWQTAAVLVAVLAAIPLVMRLLMLLTRRAAGEAGTQFTGLFEIIARLTWNWRGWVSLLIAAVGHLLSVAIFYAIGRGFGFISPMPETLAAVPAGLLGGSLPISFGGWGVREISVSGAYQLMGTAFDDVLIVSVLFGLGNLAVGLPGLILVVTSLSGGSTSRPKDGQA